jgi:hypothetical protein
MFKRPFPEYEVMANASYVEIKRLTFAFIFLAALGCNPPIYDKTMPITK